MYLCSLVNIRFMPQANRPSIRRLVAACVCLAAVSHAEVEPKAHYNLKGQGGVRDTAAPPVWKSLASGAPDLARQGSPKVMSNAPAIRRKEYDSSIQFLEADQCYQTGKNLVGGDNFVVEAWAYALKDNDGGWHAVVANGDGGSGFVLGQSGDQWSVLVGGVGGTNLGKVEANQWTHLAAASAAPISARSSRISGPTLPSLRPRAPPAAG
jgi:hypothetical protein